MDGTIYQFGGLPMVSGFGTAGPDHRARTVDDATAPLLVGVIRNPRSHRNKGLVPELSDSPNVLTRTPRTRGALVHDLAEFAAAGVGLLVVDGGDGTVRDVLTCGAMTFGDAWPQMAVLPKGKTNALAVDLGLPGNWGLQDALAAQSAGQAIIKRPLVVTAVDSPGDAQMMGFILGAGIFTAATDAGQVAHKFGAFNSVAVGVTAVAGIAQGLFGLGNGPWRRTTKMELELGEGRRPAPRCAYGKPGQRYAVLMSSLGHFPLGIRPFGSESRDINYLLVDEPLRRVVAITPLILAGRDVTRFEHLGVHQGHADSAMLTVDDTFILDGEAFPKGRYRIALGPSLRFVTP